MADLERETLHRVAARVILVDPEHRVLLIHGRDPGRPDLPSWWITVGGGLDEGESAEDGARREVWEETGLELGEVGPVVLTRTAAFEFEGVWIEQSESFFIARVEVPAKGLDTSRWNDIERRSLHELRWWTVAELAATDQVVYPEALVDVLRDNGIGVSQSD